MKKRRKNIAIILVVALIASVFGGYVFANGGGSGTGDPQEVIWTLADHLDKTTFSTELKTGWNASWQNTHVYSNTTGSPLGSSYYVCYGLNDGLHVTTQPTLPEAGSYTLYMYVPHASGTTKGKITVTEDGVATPKEFVDIDTNKTAGTWVEVGTHTYATVTPTLKFEINPTGTEGHNLRVDSVKFVRTSGGVTASPSPTAQPTAGTTASPNGEVIWSVYEHEDRAEFSTEVAPAWSAAAQQSQIYKSTSGTPYVAGQGYYTFSIANLWLKTRPVLPETRAYRMYLYVPHASGTAQGRISISENGSTTRTISRINTLQPEGSWVDLGGHLFTSTEPELKFDAPVAIAGQHFRIDTIKFVPCDESEVGPPGEDDTHLFLYDNTDENIFTTENLLVGNDFGPDYGISYTGGYEHYYCNMNGSNALFTLKYAPAGTYEVYIKIPLVHANNTDKMFVEVTDSAGQKYEEVLNIKAGNPSGIKTGDLVKIGSEFQFDPANPGEVRIGKRSDAGEQYIGHYRVDQVLLLPKNITGSAPVISSPSPTPLTLEVSLASAGYTQYPQETGTTEEQLGTKWVNSGYKTEEGPIRFTKMAGAWAKFAPYFEYNQVGQYRVYYYDFYKANTVPMNVEIKAGGQVYAPQNPIAGGLSDPAWHELGVYEFDGNGDEYVKFTATGGEYARSTAVRFELVEVTQKAPVAGNVTLKGSFVAGGTVGLEYDYADANDDAESGSTYQLYYADSKNASTWTKSVSGSCTGASSTDIQLPAEAAGKYVKIGVTPKNNAAELPVGAESFSAVIGPVPAEQKAPVAGNVTISGSLVAHTEMTGQYTYSDANFDPEEGTTYQLYYADSADAVQWTAASVSGTANAGTDIVFAIPGEAVGKYVKLGVTPKNGSATANIGAESFSNIVGPVTLNSDKPAVSALTYGGQIVLAAGNEGFAVGGKIEIDSYIYTHGEGVQEDAANTQYQWYIGSSKSGSFTPISGAAGNAYTPSSADGNKYIRVGIKPAAANGTVGEEFFGDPMLVRWNLKFADEFDYVAADGYAPQMLEKWHSDNVEWRTLGSPTSISAMRIPENVEVKDGKLFIHNRYETLSKYSAQPHTWTTGNIRTKEQFKYGYYESSYQFAPSEGLNQSFWMMTTTGNQDKFVELDFTEGRWPRRIATNLHYYSGSARLESSIKHENILPEPQTLADGANKIAGIFRPNDSKYAWNDSENDNTYQVFFNDKLVRSTVSLPYEPDAGSIYLTCAIYPGPFAGALTRNADGSYAADGTALEYEYVRFFEFLDGTAAAELSASISDAENFLSQMTVSDKFGDYTAAGASALQSAINDAKSALNDPNADEKSLQQALRSIDSAVRTAETAKNLSGTVENNKTYDLSNITREVNIEVPEGVTNVKFIFPQSQLRGQFKATFDIPNSALKGILTIPAGTKVNGVLELPPISTSQVNGDDTVTTIGFKNVKFENNLSKLELTGINGGQPGVMKNGAFNTIGKITSDSFEAARAAIGNGDHVAFVQSRLAVVYSKCLEEFALYSGQDTTPTPTPTATDNNTNNNGSWTPGGIYIPPNNNQNSDKAQFRDISGHWAEQAIKNLAQKGIIKGKTEKEFMPEDSITRAEFAALIRRAFNLNTVKYEKEFADIGDNDWYADEVQTIVDSGIMSGDGNGIFRPNDPISRQEMAKVIVNAYILKTGVTDIEAKNLSFADSYQVDAWAVEYVGKAISLGLITGYDDNTYRPGISMTRAQGAAVISRLLNK